MTLMQIILTLLPLIEGYKINSIHTHGRGYCSCGKAFSKTYSLVLTLIPPFYQVIDNGSGMCKAGCNFFCFISYVLTSLTKTFAVAGDEAPRAVFP
jgi:hypothetical protein